MRYLKFLGISLFIIGLAVFTASIFMSSHQLTPQIVDKIVGKAQQKPIIAAACADMYSQKYSNNIAFVSAVRQRLFDAKISLDSVAKTPIDGVSEWDIRMSDYDIDSYTFGLTKYSTVGVLTDYAAWLLYLSFGLGIVGALMYILPNPTTNNNGIFRSPTNNKGWIGIAIGVYLIAFYVGLYWFPYYITSWTILLDPLSRSLNGGDASQWFLYGILYCVAMVVMGIRMAVKYRHNRYQLFRTASVVFFQLAFAFFIPEILTSLNQPSMDLKSAFPLDYTFYYDYRINKTVGQGADLGFARLGTIMFIWGVALTFIVVPFLTYWYGKRWYCSWVCGCGGLAETLGDPFRQLSDKSVKAWKIERYLINFVLVFAVVMTGMVLYTYFTGMSQILFLDSYKLQKWYGFFIGATFSGVVGTGFYPLMGNRVWCRFGCPLAAAMGIVQRFKSRFRITTNGGQCISCGNCSTYCEMGIDVRSYAQRGQDIVRASCVGCGICSAVCPRGVLRLENASEDVAERAMTQRGLQIVDGKISLVE
jgi:ferredoxin-type protein NapH